MTETRLERWHRQPHFTCPRCGIKSWNPHDIHERYCGRCHTFFAFEPRRTEPAQYRSEPARHNDDVSSPFPTFSADPAPPTAPDSPAFEPGGGSSGGGGASGDW